MENLSTSQKRELLEIIEAEVTAYRCGFDSFSDKVNHLLDDIAGFETVSESVRTNLINEFWKDFQMTKKQTPTTKPDDKTVETSAEVSVPVEGEAIAVGEKDEHSLVANAVTIGKEMSLSGQATKADVAWKMFGTINHLPREVVIQAFIDGAGLTEKGARTYWYNCRKKAGV